MCFVLIYCKYFSLPETEIDIYKYLWEKLFENVQDSLKLFVLWDWNKSGSYQWVTRGHCDSSSCIVWKRNSALKGIFDFSEEFCWHPENCNQIWRVWEVHGNRYDCVWADQEITFFGYRKIQVLGAFKIWKWCVLICFPFGLRLFWSWSFSLFFPFGIFYITVVVVSVLESPHDINQYLWNRHLHCSDFKVLLSIK